MQIVSMDHGSVRVLAVTGSVDSLSADSLSQHFKDALAQGKPRLVADFAAVTYTSSAGLRALLGAVKQCRLAGGDLRMAALQPQVMRVLDIAGFTSMLNIYPDVAGALHKFGDAA